MNRAVGAVALAALAACSPSSEADDTLTPVGSGASVVATVPGSTPTGPLGSGVVQMSIDLNGSREELLLDRSTMAVSALDPITLDARCTGLDGGDGYVVSIVDVRRLSAGQELVSAVLRATDDAEPVTVGEHPAVLELGTSQQQVSRFEGVMVLDPTRSSGTFDVSAAAGGGATGSFACADDAASLPTTTTTPVVVASAESVADTVVDVTVPIGSPPVTAPAVTVPAVTASAVTVPVATRPLATS